MDTETATTTEGIRDYLGDFAADFTEDQIGIITAAALAAPLLRLGQVDPGGLGKALRESPTVRTGDQGRLQALIVADALSERRLIIDVLHDSLERGEHHHAALLGPPAQPTVTICTRKGKGPMTDSKIIDQIRQLLRIASDRGASINERELAQRRAERLMVRHRIETLPEGDARARDADVTSIKVEIKGSSPSMGHTRGRSGCPRW